jgi:hypothetical protein
MCWHIGNMAEASEELLRCFIERVASYFFHDLALTYGRMPEEVLHGGVIGGLPLRSKNPFLYNSFFKNRKSFLESILLRSFIVPIEILSRKTVFVSVRTSLIVLGFGVSVQLVCHDLLLCHGGGGVEEVA